MTEIALDKIHSAQDSETARLWRMMKKPEAVQKAITQQKYSREVQILKKDIQSSRSNGTVNASITPEGKYLIEIGYRENRESEPTTYAEETLHLLQELLNPMYMQQTERANRAKKQLADLGIDSLPSSLASMFTSSFLDNVDASLLSFAERVGVEGLANRFITKKELLKRFLTSSLKSPGLHMSKSVIVNLTKVIEKWGFNLLSDEERTLFTDEEELRRTQYFEIRNFPKDASLQELDALNMAQRDKRKPIEDRIEHIFERIAQTVETFTDEEVEKLFILLGLRPLLTVENYTVARELFSKTESAKIRASVESYVTSADSVRLERIHYLLRPAGYYHNFHISTDDWLNTDDDETRRAQCFDRLTTYHDSSLSRLFLELVDEELSQLWIEGAAEHAILTHPMFWDVTDGSTLPTNADYVQKNVKAIKDAVASGEVQLPTLLTQAAQTKGNDFRLLPVHLAKEGDGHAALLVDRIDDERRARAMSRFDTWQILSSRVRNYLDIGIEILIENPTIPSLQFLIDRLVGISYLLQECAADNVMKSFLAELVAKSIKMYLIGEKEPLGDMYGGDYTFLLTSEKPEVHSNHIKPGESIWQGLIDKIIEVLNDTDDDGELILKLIQAKNIKEVAKVVEYELG